MKKTARKQQKAPPRFVLTVSWDEHEKLRQLAEGYSMSRANVVRRLVSNATVPARERGK